MRPLFFIFPTLIFLLQACGHVPDRTEQRQAEHAAEISIKRKDYATAASVYLEAARKYNDPADYDVRAQLLSSAALWQAQSGRYNDAMAALDECTGLRRTITSKVWVESCESDKEELRTRTGLYANIPALAKVGQTSEVGATTKGASSAANSGDCPTSLAYIEPRLPRCTANANLMELRRMSLEADVSFRADLAQGYSYQKIGVAASQAAIEFENAMKQTEDAMLQASANAALARARLAALRAVPPRCDAGPVGAFGMGENSYQAYAAQYIGAVVNRAVAAVAACRARQRP